MSIGKSGIIKFEFQTTIFIVSDLTYIPSTIRIMLILYFFIGGGADWVVWAVLKISVVFMYFFCYSNLQLTEISFLILFQDTGEESNHRIWEKDFADLLLTYADYSPKKRSAVLKRVKKRHSLYVRTVGV